ncbi:translocation/assembly module TamB domain-containing protein [Undibacterium sp. LX40W]|uniref:Translocation/assembly module TamB domain-containing protein n=1 Tax=Undibacterium nitidum TaxID=2762298 RepID=A0A923KUU6_9BURK|nr:MULTISPECIES: translocation/assembly module TamB domain-containing protein [Undibacterium]MBC3882557.1 translocation/assembly module TamB domain-containing protein [Undibacterium nitidum]MBC3892838.1 translocation/assembly module TamB domain-containing protein [Undibacterium sp. LX40W]
MTSSTPSKDSDSGEKITPLKTRPSLVKRLSKRCAWLILFAFVLVVLFVAWLFQTTSGTRFALGMVQELSLHRLQFKEIDGRLADKLKLAEFQYQDSTETIVLSGLELEWKPWHLWRGQLELTSVNASKLRISSKPSHTPVAAPKSLQLPLPIHIQQAALGQLLVNEVAADGKEILLFKLHALTASGTTSAQDMRLQLKAKSQWGNFDADAKMQNQSPFNIQGRLNYSGQANPDIPVVSAVLDVSGSLLDLDLKADIEQVLSGSSQGQKLEGARGNVHLQLLPFASRPLKLAKIDLNNFDPSHLNASAPTALLDVQLDVHDDDEQSALNTKTSAVLATNKNQKVVKPKSNDAKNKVESKPQQSANAENYFAVKGKLVVRNTRAKSFDQHGVPFKAAQATLNWRQDRIQLSDLQLQMLSGSFVGDAQLELKEHALPVLDAHLKASEIDLLHFDSRLRHTQIKGELQIQTKRERFIDFQVQASDARNRLDGKASFEFNAAGNNGSLHVEKIELQADQSLFAGSGDINFEGQKPFQLQGKLTQFNPAMWSTLPSGKLDSEIKINGTLSPKTNLQLQLSQLDGEFATHKLAGQTKLNWIEDQLLNVENLDLQWGKNSLLASGLVGKNDNELNWVLKAQDLSPFSSLLGLPISGKANVDGKVGGVFGALTTRLDAQLENFAMKQWRLADASLKLVSGAGKQGALSVDLQAKQMQTAVINLNASGTDGLPLEKKRTWAEVLRFQLSGNRDAHHFDLQTQFDKTHRTELRGDGGLDLSELATANWKGMFKHFKLVGFSGSQTRSEVVDLQMLAPMNVEFSRSKVSFGSGKFGGAVGKLNVDQLEWTPVSMQAKGSADEVRLMELLNMWKIQTALAGDLRLGLKWDLQLKGSAQGRIELQRQSGDLLLTDADGAGQVMPLGLTEVQASVQAGGLLPGTDAERVRIDFSAQGKRLGQWRANLNTELRQKDEKWTLDSEAPVSGELHATMPELQWLASQLSSEFGLKGSMNLDAKIAGKMGKPTYQAKVEGKGLELAVASEGLLFPNGELRAELTEKTVKLQQLHFSNKINFIPKIEQTRDLNWMGQEGEFFASGEINWVENSGAIGMQWKKFPLLQRKDRWLVMSGDAKITQADRVWSLIGKLGADAAYFKLPKMPPPSLSSDVIVNQPIKLDPEQSDLEADKKGFKTKLDLQIDMGPRFVFVGRGLNTALTGTMRMRMNDNGSLQASGSIATNGGQYEGYGQQLEIERGILKFQGSPSNPSLNVRALRKGLLVEAGVEVTGNVANPQVRLVSEPNVPDNDKISWLILGREADQLGVNDASLLLTAAGAIFGSDGSGNIPKDLARGLGFDEFSIGPAENGGSSKLPSQTIAGETTVGSVTNDNVLTIGWRMKPGLVLSIERGMSDASSALKASWQLGRRVRLVARAGTDVSLDVKYSFSFN